MPDETKNKRVKSGSKPGLKVASGMIDGVPAQEYPINKSIVGGKSYGGTLYSYDKKYKAVSDTVTSFMDNEGGPEAYLRDAYRERKPATQKPSVPKKKNTVIDEITSKYRK